MDTRRSTRTECVSRQHALPAPTSEYLIADTLLAFTDAFKQGFFYVDKGTFSG